LDQLPDLAEYKVDPYVRAVAALQGLGREEALVRLLAFARDRKQGGKVTALCRMLFAKKAGAESRRPLLGEPVFLGDTNHDDWPLEPITLVDGIPFCVVLTYRSVGVDESYEYVRYCVDNCDWSTLPLKEHTELEKRNAVSKLLSSFKRHTPIIIHGADLSDDHVLTASERQFLLRQIE